MKCWSLKVAETEGRLKGTKEKQIDYARHEEKLREEFLTKVATFSLIKQEI